MYFWILQCKLANSNTSGILNPSMWGTSIILTLLHSMNCEIIQLTYKFVSCQYIPYKVGVYLIHRWEVDSPCCCKHSVDFCLSFSSTSNISDVYTFQLYLFHNNDYYLIDKFILKSHQNESVIWLVAIIRFCQIL